jgi:integrase
VAARQASKSRRKTRPANATINRELSILGTLLRLAARRQKCLRPPTITLLKEAAPRAGFFEPAQFASVRRFLRPDLQLAVDLAYTYGWRVRDEVLTLERRHVDLAAGTVRLDPGSTKNGEGRVVYLTPALSTALAEQAARMRALEHRLGRIVPHVFAHAGDGPHNPKTGARRYLAGDRIHDFRRAWRTACKNAGCPGMLRHDFRRTAVRNLVNDGTPEKVAMIITGHRTRSVFDRYHIVAPEDLRAATARIAARTAAPTRARAARLT